MSYETATLDSICDKIMSGGTPKTSNRSFYVPEQVPWLKTGEVNYSRIYDTETYISKEGLERSSAKLVPVNSVIVAMYGQGDTAGRVAINKIPLATNQACCNLVINKNIADYEYVYYALSTMYDKFVSLKNGGAQPNLNVGLIKALEIPLPNIEVQHRIASILSKFDDLIETNQKQIKLLEEAAQRLYKEWFVDLRFPGHEDVKIVDGVPEGWKKVKLTDIADVQYGYAFDSTLFNTNKNGVPIIRIRNIPSGNTDDYTLEEVDEQYLVHNGDIVVGMDGEFHINSWCGEDSYLVQRVCRIRPHNENMRGWLLNAIYDPIKYFEKTVVGATVAHLGKKHIDTIMLLTGAESFYEPFQNMFDMRLKLLNQNKRATEARNRLLPKLMTGEIKL
jgi:type I restriction enzyme S subunit